MAKETAYVGIGVNNGKIVHKDEAFEYALEQLNKGEGISETDKQNFVEWFFSGSWIEEEIEE